MEDMGGLCVCCFFLGGGHVPGECLGQPMNFLADLRRILDEKLTHCRKFEISK